MATQPLTILRRKQVESRCGISRSSIYQGIKDGTFPAPIRLGNKSVGWIESDINNWIQQRIDEGCNPQP